MRTTKFLPIVAVLLWALPHLASQHARAQGRMVPPQEDLAHAVVRIPSHGASATVIATGPGKSLLLGCGHAYFGPDRTKKMVFDVPNPLAGAPKKVGSRLLAVDYEADLSLVELEDGPLPFVAPVAPGGHRCARRLLSVGYDEMTWPATQRPADLLFTQGDTTWTRQMPWHGRSGGALLDTQAGYLVGVVSGYETTGQRRGIYVSHEAIVKFLARSASPVASAPGFWGVQGGGTTPIQPPLAPSPGIGYLSPRPGTPGRGAGSEGFYSPRLSAPAPICGH